MQRPITGTRREADDEVFIGDCRVELDCGSVTAEIVALDTLGHTSLARARRSLKDHEPAFLKQSIYLTFLSTHEQVGPQSINEREVLPLVVLQCNPPPLKRIQVEESLSD